MRRTKPLAALAVASLMALAACGSGDGPGETGSGEFGKTDAGADKDPDAEGPAPEVEGAQSGGTITVFLPGDYGPDDLDPTNGWSVTGNSIQQALTSRSLTQYRVDSDGNAATYTGQDCFDWAGGTTGRSGERGGYAIQGNILTGPEVVEAMENSPLCCGRRSDGRVCRAVCTQTWRNSSERTSERRRR